MKLQALPGGTGGWHTILYTRRLQVWPLVQAHMGDNWSMFLSHQYFSLKTNKNIQVIKRKKIHQVSIWNPKYHIAGPNLVTGFKALIYCSLAPLGVAQLTVNPTTKRSLVQFPVRVYAQVAVSSPSMGHKGGSQSMMLPSLMFLSLPLWKQ